MPGSGSTRHFTEPVSSSLPSLRRWYRHLIVHLCVSCAGIPLVGFSPSCSWRAVVHSSSSLSSCNAPSESHWSHILPGECHDFVLSPPAVALCTPAIRPAHSYSCLGSLLSLYRDVLTKWCLPGWSQCFGRPNRLNLWGLRCHYFRLPTFGLGMLEISQPT